MPRIKVGRYSDKEGVEFHDEYDMEARRWKCRLCGKPGYHPQSHYCCPEHRLEWWKKNSPHAWTWMRDEVLKRDDHKCVVCGEPASAVHHIKPVKLYPELEFDIDNCISVCTKHHTHNMKLEKAKKFNAPLTGFT